MTFARLLQKHKEGIVEQWLGAALASYPDDSAAAFRRQKDPFANPVGHSLRVGTRGIFDALLDGMDPATIRQHLGEIIKIRAVQQLPASGALSFVFHLKHAVRTELGKAAEDPQHSCELTELEDRIDQVALAAFDVYVQCREQLCELRVNEAKRKVSWIMTKINERDLDPQLSWANVDGQADQGHETCD